MVFQLFLFRLLPYISSNIHCEAVLEILQSRGEALEERNVEPRCGIQVVDLRSGDAVHWIRFEGLVTELYDVITLPGARNPSLIGVVSDEIRRLISIEDAPGT